LLAHDIDDSRPHAFVPCLTGKAAIDQVQGPGKAPRVSRQDAVVAS
jgi:hypothetical protein